MGRSECLTAATYYPDQTYGSFTVEEAAADPPGCWITKKKNSNTNDLVLSIHTGGDADPLKEFADPERMQVCEIPGAGRCDPGHCGEGTVYAHGTCWPPDTCALNCESCSERGGGQCDRCKPGYRVHTIVGETTCVACKAGCRSCSEEQCDECEEGLVRNLDGGCGTQEATLEGLEELFGTKEDEKKKPSSSGPAAPSAAGTREMTQFDVIITLRRAFALELAQSPEAVLLLRAAVAEGFDVPLGQVEVFSRVLHGRRLQDEAASSNEKALAAGGDPPEAAVTVSVGVVLPPTAPPWSDNQRAKVEVTIAYHLEREASEHGFSWGEVPPENVIVLHRPEAVEVKEEDPRSTWSVVIGAAMVAALAGLAIGGFWFATRAKEQGDVLPKWKESGIPSLTSWMGKSRTTYHDSATADVRSYPTRINVAAPSNSPRFEGVGAVPSVQSARAGAFKPRGPNTVAARALSSFDDRPKRPPLPTVPTRQVQQEAVFSRGVAPAVGHNPPRPPAEPRIVNGRPRGLHAVPVGMHGAPMMQSSPRSASVGVSIR